MSVDSYKNKESKRIVAGLSIFLIHTRLMHSKYFRSELYRIEQGSHLESFESKYRKGDL